MATKADLDAISKAYDNALRAKAGQPAGNFPAQSAEDGTCPTCGQSTTPTPDPSSVPISKQINQKLGTGDPETIF